MVIRVDLFTGIGFLKYVVVGNLITVIVGFYLRGWGVRLHFHLRQKIVSILRCLAMILSSNFNIGIPLYCSRSLYFSLQVLLNKINKIKHFLLKIEIYLRNFPVFGVAY